VATRWNELAALPAPWEPVLRGRAGIDGDAPPADAFAALGVDALLLQLEAAWQLPSPPAFETERRVLRLQAMKAAMESRRTTPPPPAPDALLASGVGRRGLEPAQRARLGAVIEAMRRRGGPRPS